MKILTAIIAIATFGTAAAGGLAQLEFFNQNTRTVSGSFVQTVTGAKKTERAAGTFDILRPNRFRWEYTGAAPQTIVADGRDLWLYDPDLNQVVVSSQSGSIASSPAAILSDAAALQKYYRLQEDGSDNGIDYISAEPQNTDNTAYRDIRIGFRDNLPSNMALSDAFGNRIRLDFSNLKTNSPLSTSRFHFSPPTGADVLHQ